MTWSTVHDEMLCREILVVDPFTGTKKGTVARGTRWEEVAVLHKNTQHVLILELPIISNWLRVLFYQ